MLGNLIKPPTTEVMTYCNPGKFCGRFFSRTGQFSVKKVNFAHFNFADFDTWQCYIIGTKYICCIIILQIGAYRKNSEIKRVSKIFLVYSKAGLKVNILPWHMQHKSDQFKRLVALNAFFHYNVLRAENVSGTGGKLGTVAWCYQLVLTLSPVKYL